MVLFCISFNIQLLVWLFFNPKGFHFWILKSDTLNRMKFKPLFGCPSLNRNFQGDPFGIVTPCLAIDKMHPHGVPSNHAAEPGKSNLATCAEPWHLRGATFAG